MVKLNRFDNNVFTRVALQSDRSRVLQPTTDGKQTRFNIKAPRARWKAVDLLFANRSEIPGRSRSPRNAANKTQRPIAPLRRRSKVLTWREDKT